MKTDIIVITDRSGSMGAIKNDVIGGYNQFLRDQKEVEGEARITFIQFDHEYQVLYSEIPLQDAPELTAETFVPRGSTALLDAVGITLDERLSRNPSWAELVVMVIITDGEENSSTKYDLPRVRALTTEAEGLGWKFIYLAANQDAFNSASMLGMQQPVAANYTADSAGVAGAYGVASASTKAFRSS